MARVGIVGYGLAGAGFHVPLARAAGLEIAGVVTRAPERVARAAADLPDAQVVPDLETLLGLPELDLVVVASPSGSHVEHARSVLAAGIPVVVDKPLACEAGEGAALVEEARQHGIPLTVFQNRRWDPEFRTALDLVRSGALGDLHRTELRWERWRPRSLGRWRETQSAAEGGGLLLDLVTHLVDQAVVLHGPVATVYAELAARTTHAEDDVFLALRHADGHPTHVFASSVAGASGPRMRIGGSAGTFVLGSAGTEGTSFPDADGGPGQHGWLVRGADREPVTARAADPADFYRQVAAALASDHPQAAMPVDPRDAVHVLAVLDAARASAEAGHIVEVRTPDCQPGVAPA